MVWPNSGSRQPVTANGPPRIARDSRPATRRCRRVATSLCCWPPTPTAPTVLNCGNRLPAHGIQYGPAFAGLVSAGTGAGRSVLAEVALPPALRSQQSAYSVHPALLDACFQAVAVHPAIRDDSSGALLLPLGVRRIRVHAATRQAHYRPCAGHEGRRGVGRSGSGDPRRARRPFSSRSTACGSDRAPKPRNRDRTLNNRLLTVDWIPAEPAEGGGDFGNRSVLVIDPAGGRTQGCRAAWWRR